MKNLIIFSTLVVMAVINFTGCGKAQERPAKPNKEIAGQVVAIDGLIDITKAEQQNSPENISFKKRLIAKLETAEKRAQAEDLLAQNRLVYMLMEGKVVVLEFIPATTNKHATASVSATVAASETVAVAADQAQATSTAKLYTYEALMALKAGHTEEATWAKVTLASQNHFVILAEIGMQTGILENETTDYDEKKSTLKLTETSLEQAQVLLLQAELNVAATADVSGDESK